MAHIGARLPGDPYVCPKGERARQGDKPAVTPRLRRRTTKAGGEEIIHVEDNCNRVVDPVGETDDVKFFYCGRHGEIEVGTWVTIPLQEPAAVQLLGNDATPKDESRLPEEPKIARVAHWLSAKSRRE